MLSSHFTIRHVFDMVDMVIRNNICTYIMMYLYFFIARSLLCFISSMATAAAGVGASRAAPATKQNTLATTSTSKNKSLDLKWTHLDREFDLDLERDPERDRDGLREGLRLPERERREPERDLADLLEAALRRDRRDPTLPASEPLPEKLLASESDIFRYSKPNLTHLEIYFRINHKKFFKSSVNFTCLLLFLAKFFHRLYLKTQKRQSSPQTY